MVLSTTRFQTLPNLGWRVVTISCIGIMMSIMVWVLEPLGYVNGVRYRNRGPIQHYLKAIAEDGHARLHEEHLTKAEMMEEEFFLGLR